VRAPAGNDREFPGGNTMKKTLAVLGGAVLALSALLAPLQVSVSPAYGDGLVDISTCKR